MPLKMFLFPVEIKDLFSSPVEFPRRQFSSFSWLKGKLYSFLFFSIVMFPIKCQCLDFERNYQALDNGPKVYISDLVTLIGCFHLFSAVTHETKTFGLEIQRINWSKNVFDIKTYEITIECLWNSICAISTWPLGHN